MTATYSEAPNKAVSAANGIDYAYRQLGDGAAPLILPPTLPRQSGQLGSRARRFAGVDSAGRDVRHPRRRRFHRNDAEHRDRDGT
jgi:hypothetical protein